LGTTISKGFGGKIVFIAVSTSAGENPKTQTSLNNILKSKLVSKTDS
jgi:hypothetical protein